jgi:quinol monooxygenase YgiN
MIIVLGSVLAKPDCLDRLLTLSREHVMRSRTEPGCIAHAVHQDVENQMRLVFVEQWSDRSALMAHFAVPASLAFVKAATVLAAERPKIHIYDTSEIKI